MRESDKVKNISLPKEIIHKIKWILLVYLFSVILRIVLSSFVVVPYIWGDEMLYSKIAHSFFASGRFLYHEKPLSIVSPLYPVCISAAYIFDNMWKVYHAMKIISCFLSSLIVFPTWLISREFLSEKKSIIVALLVSITPTGLVFTSVIMTENLFYPLFLFAIFFTMKAINKNEHKWDILSGITIGLCILTRMIGLILVIALPIVLVLDAIVKEYMKTKDKQSVSTSKKIMNMLKKSLCGVRKKWLIFFTSFLIIMPWFVRNGILFGWTSRGITGYGNIEEAAAIVSGAGASFSIMIFSKWLIWHTGYFIIATGAIFFIVSLILLDAMRNQRIGNGNKFNNLLTFVILSWVSWVLFILVASHHAYPNHPYLMGRYIIPAVPCFLIMGCIGIDKYDFKKINLYKILTVIALCSLILSVYPFSHFATLNTPDTFFLLRFKLQHLIPASIIVRILLVLSPFLFLAFLKFKLLQMRYIVPIFIVFFLLVSLTPFHSVHTGSVSLSEGQQKIGMWLNANDKNESVILFDERDEDSTFFRGSAGFWTLIEFWTPNDEIIIGDVRSNKSEVDYIISSHELNLPKVITVKSVEYWGGKNITLYKR